MTRKESDMLRELSGLISKCPAPSMNVYALAGYIDACRDYIVINRYVVEFLTNYSEYSDHKILVHSGEADQEDADYYKERAETALQSLRDFIQERTEKHWVGGGLS